MLDSENADRVLQPDCRLPVCSEYSILLEADTQIECPRQGNF